MFIIVSVWQSAFILLAYDGDPALLHAHAYAQHESSVQGPQKFQKVLGARTKSCYCLNMHGTLLTILQGEQNCFYQMPACCRR